MFRFCRHATFGASFFPVLIRLLKVLERAPIQQSFHLGHGLVCNDHYCCFSLCKFYPPPPLCGPILFRCCLLCERVHPRRSGCRCEPTRLTIPRASPFRRFSLAFFFPSPCVLNFDPLVDFTIHYLRCVVSAAGPPFCSEYFGPLVNRPFARFPFLFVPQRLLQHRDPTPRSRALSPFPAPFDISDDM